MAQSVVKTKSIIISSETHEKLKRGIGKKFKLGEVVEIILNNFLTELESKGEEILIKLK